MIIIVFYTFLYGVSLRHHLPLKKPRAGFNYIMPHLYTIHSSYTSLRDAPKSRSNLLFHSPVAARNSLWTLAGLLSLFRCFLFSLEEFASTSNAGEPLLQKPRTFDGWVGRKKIKNCSRLKYDTNWITTIACEYLNNRHAAHTEWMSLVGAFWG